MLTLRILSLILVLGYNNIGYGYNLTDHDLITNRAVLVFNHCQPSQTLTDYQVQVLNKGNRREDFNLASKWLKNSHYYNPNRWVRTLYRGDASQRLKSLLAKLKPTAKGETASIHLLGQIVHFLQDVTSPPHVAPIIHGPTDGFESFVVDYHQVINREIFCQQQHLQEPLAILKRYAQQTLATLKDLNLAEKDGYRFEFSWQLFWSEGLGSNFGFYGFFGNNFGNDQPIKILGHSYSFRQETFRQFKLQQIQRAVEATILALSWYQQLSIESSLVKQEAGVTRLANPEREGTSQDS